jgi:hypothetical protein
MTGVHRHATGVPADNATLLPATITALRGRRPSIFAQLDRQLPAPLETIAADLRDRARAPD